MYGVAMVAASLMIVFLGGCGNTVTGVGKDISHVGKKITAWQDEPSATSPKEVKHA